LLLVFISAIILRSESREAQNYIRDSPSLEEQVPVFIFLRHRGGDSYTRRQLDSLFIASYDSQGYDEFTRTHLPTGFY
jgi:hypothetical protein